MSFTFDPYKLRTVDVSEANDVLMTNATATTEMETYWRSLPRKRGVPSRKDVSPADMGGLLEDSFVLERLAPGVARIRVAGRNVRTLLGTEPRGLPVTAAFLPGSRADLSKHLEDAFLRPGLVEIELTSPRAVGQPKLQGKILLLPLRDDHGRVSRILGVLVMSGRRGIGGRRLSIADNSAVRFEPVVGLHPVDNAMSVPDRRSIRGLSNSTQAGDRPALRLVVSNT